MQLPLSKGLFILDNKVMTLEKLLEAIPPTYKVDAGLAGFCLRYSVRLGCWISSHGSMRGAKTKMMGKGATPKEAVEDFIRKVAQKHEVV